MDNHKVVVILALFFCAACGDENVPFEFSNANDTQALILHSFEVPDSSLLLLDRLRLKGFPKMRAKQTIETNSTSTNYTTTSSSSSSSSSSSDDSSSSSGLCNCDRGVCKCCTGLIMNLFNQKACMKVTYHPGDFAFDVAMDWNGYVLYENSLSGRSPRPICVSPPRIRNLKLCAKFSDVFFPGRNFHFCLSMTGKWQNFELFNRSFNCLRMGADGIAMMRPEENGGLVIPNPQGGVDAVVDSGDDIEDYDENVVKSFLDIFDEDDRRR